MPRRNGILRVLQRFRGVLLRRSMRSWEDMSRLSELEQCVFDASVFNKRSGTFFGYEHAVEYENFAQKRHFTYDHFDSGFHGQISSTLSSQSYQGVSG